MGYRSDVVALIYPDMTHDGDDSVAKYEQLKTLMNTTFKTLWDDDFGGDAEWLDDSKVLKFNISNVKWYESYPDVRRFEDMLHTLNGDPNDGDDVIGGYCTEFVRIGEDENDVVRDVCGNNPHYYLRVSRSIVCDA
jgi:hypothetical protein